MAINFPADAVDGQVYNYPITQQQFTCRRSGPSAPAQWAAVGTINPTSFGYRGGTNVTGTAPSSAQTGNIYTVLDGGTASSSFTGLTGSTVEQYSLIIYSDPNWYPLDADQAEVITGPWTRSADGKIQPAVATDNLSMDEGNFLINELDLL